MDEKILMLLSEMDPYMPSGTMVGFLHKNRKKITYNVSFSRSEKAEDISILDMGVRANNCLRRAGFHTLGELVDALEAKEGEEGSKSKLLRLRNLGRKTAEEILLMIMYHQFRILSEAEKHSYVKEIVEINTNRTQ